MGCQDVNGKFRFRVLGVPLVLEWEAKYNKHIFHKGEFTLVKSELMRPVEALVLATACLFFALGCPDESTEPTVLEQPRYPDASTKDIVISNLFKRYDDRDIGQYEKLLHNDYTWYNKAGEDSESFSREQIENSRNMFLAALHQQPDTTGRLDKLVIEIHPGIWDKLLDFGGDACDDCWKTMRDYHMAWATTDGTTTAGIQGAEMFVVIPADMSGTKVYQIIARYDLQKQSTLSSVAP